MWSKDSGLARINANGCYYFRQAADVAPRAKWIRVEERLPGGNGVFLVSLKEGGYENLVYFDVRRYEDGEWRNIPDKLTVSHWMPLPEPPVMKGV
jgi:hypothetical protein